VDFGLESSDLDRKKAEAFDDHQRELAGVDAGRIPRFLARHLRSEVAREKDKADREHGTRLAMLLAHADYRRSFEAAWVALTQAEQATTEALELLALEEHSTAELIHDMEDRAARLPDGTMVFRDAEGTLRRADGSEVTGPDAATIFWSGDEPSFEEYQAQLDRLDRLQANRAAILAYQIDVLGNARDRLSDEDDPLTQEELDDILRDIEEAMPEPVQRQLAPEALVETTPTALPTADQVPKL